MKKLPLLVVILFTASTYATTITVFSENNGLCRYVITDNNAKPVATWEGDCLKSFTNATTIDIAKGTRLWKKLKRLDHSFNLQNIQIIITHDELVIAKLKSLSIPEIKVGKHEMVKSLRINNVAGNHSEKQEAQDYNSSRSNKANSISTAQDYNSSRSNKANSISTAQDYNSSRSNKANSISTAQDYNSSRSNKANSISTAQDYNSSRSNKSGIILSAGIALSDKNSNMKNGLAFNVDYNIQVKNNFGIEVGIGNWSNSFSYSASPVLPEEYKNTIEAGTQNNKWNNLSLSAGPSLMLGKRKCNATIYAKAAVLFTKIPQQKIGSDNPVAVFGGNKTSFAFNPGLRLNYSMNSQLSLFINPEFISSLTKNIPYKEKDVSKAMNADGKFNPDTFNSLPLEQEYMRISLFGLNAGIKINL